MKIQHFRGTTNRRTMFIGLLRNTYEAIKMIVFISLVVGIILAPFVYLIEKKTSDKEYCVRVVSEKARIELHCPPLTPIALIK